MGLPENEWFIEAPWGRVCILAWGDCCDPPVLLCHGAVDSAACFRPLVQLLPRKYYYIAVELPGNGRSDPYPPGLMVSCYDLVFVLALLVRHFRWESFVFMGHSMGTIIGKLYNLSYPGRISKVINFDPITNRMTVPSDLYSEWYHQHFMKYFENFEAYYRGSEKAPQYKWQDVVTSLKTNRGLSDEAAAATLERISEPTGNGMIRYTFDQRMKGVVRPPFFPESIQDIFTKKITTPTLSIIAEGSVKIGNYSHTPFKFDEKAWPHGNYRVRRVEGGHDVHFVNPERVAGYVSQFLQFGLEGLDSRAKL